MSRLYWHSLSDGTAELLGAEFMHCRCVTVRLAKAMLPSVDIARHRMTPSAQERIFKSDWPNFERDMRLWLDSGDEDTNPMFIHNGGPIDNHHLILNTALALGNDVVALFARITGQGCLHAYVEGPYREWLAGIIREGLQLGVCRSQVYAHDTDGRRFNPRPSGWEDVIKLLLTRDSEPVVMSYSVDMGFPDPELCGVDFNDEAAIDRWDSLPEEARWSTSMAALRLRDQRAQLEINPETLRLPFGHCVSLFELFNE